MRRRVANFELVDRDALEKLTWNSNAFNTVPYGVQSTAHSRVLFERLLNIGNALERFSSSPSPSPSLLFSSNV